MGWENVKLSSDGSLVIPPRRPPVQKECQQGQNSRRDEVGSCDEEPGGFKRRVDFFCHLGCYDGDDDEKEASR